MSIFLESQHGSLECASVVAGCRFWARGSDALPAAVNGWERAVLCIKTCL